jgi:outer membrane protein OmpA-like peptidoglycan-associated protein
MIGIKVTYLALAASILFAGVERLNAQTIGYAEALGELAVSCDKDIAKFCARTNLSGGAVAECLEQNQANVSPRCKSAAISTAALLKKRAAARMAVPRVCELDRLKYCGGIVPGDANLLECFETAKRNISANCRQAVSDAGYEAPLATGPVTNQIHLSSDDIVSSLQGVEQSLPGISAANLRQRAIESIRDPSRANRMNRPPLFEQLNSHAQLTVAIQFDLNSSRIRPSSYRAVGLIADALYSPYLQGYCFLVVGNTDATGSREYNLKLSDQRADAIRQALINPFGINSQRIQAVGLGEEQLLDPGHPAAAENRRVQLINIGKLGSNAACANRPEGQIR